MPIEVERKFLVISDSWRTVAAGMRRFRQGYLSSADAGKSSIRVRTDGEVAHLNIKAAVVGTTRAEYEYEIPQSDAEEILNHYCGACVEKTRYWVPHQRHTWEVDVFEGDNAGLVVAELELSHADEAFARPDWVGIEVTEQHRYYNNQLARHPFREWKKSD